MPCIRVIALSVGIFTVGVWRSALTGYEEVKVTFNIAINNGEISLIIRTTGYQMEQSDSNLIRGRFFIYLYSPLSSAA